MEVTEKLLKVVMTEVGTDPKAVSDKLAEIKMFHRAWQTLENAKVIASKEWDNKIRGLNQDVTNLRGKCKHWTTTYFTGSGNNDSYSTCDVCGAEL